jgi:hypothetical protein
MWWSKTAAEWATLAGVDDAVAGGGVEDLAALLEAHTCSGQCSRRTHSQPVLLAPADVATFLDELRMLTRVRHCLTEHGYRMLETVPTPQFEPGATESKSWAVRYDEEWGKVPKSDAAASAPGWWPWRRRRPGRT